jgi:hypothetical protein
VEVLATEDAPSPLNPLGIKSVGPSASRTRISCPPARGRAFAPPPAGKTAAAAAIAKAAFDPAARLFA